MSYKNYLPIYALVFLLAAPVAFSQNEQTLSLEQCIELALENNSSLLISERQTRIAESDVKSARSAILPSLDLSLYKGRFQRGDQITEDIRAVEYDTLQAPVFDIDNPEDVVGFFFQRGAPTRFEKGIFSIDGFTVDQNRARVDFRWMAFDFGKSWYDLRSASAAADASHHSYDDAEQSTVLTVHQRYYEHLKALRLLEVQQEEVKSNEEQLKRVESMYEIGSVAQGDVFRQRTTLGNSRIRLINQRNAVDDTRQLLNIALGRDPNTPIAIADIAGLEQTREYTVEEVLSTAMSENPGLKNLEYEMQSAELNAKAAKLNYLPSFTVSGSYSRSNSDFNRVYGDFDQNWDVAFGVSMNVNLFNGFADQAQVERSSVSYHIAKENLIDRKRNLRLEVEQALRDLRALREIASINEENLESSEEDLRLAQERYRVGAGTLLDIIDAQFNLTNSRAIFVNAKYDMMIAHAQLEYVMGTLSK